MAAGWVTVADMREYRQKPATQLGTVGSGNPLVDLMRDEAGFVWIGVHFGNRGLGRTSAKEAGGTDGMKVPAAVIDEDGELGQRYIAAMQLAGPYSYAGREWVVERVRRIIGGSGTEMVRNPITAWRETVKVLHTLRPSVVAMAGEGEFDPWKD